MGENRQQSADADTSPSSIPRASNTNESFLTFGGIHCATLTPEKCASCILSPQPMAEPVILHNQESFSELSRFDLVLSKIAADCLVQLSGITDITRAHS